MLFWVLSRPNPPTKQYQSKKDNPASLYMSYIYKFALSYDKYKVYQTTGNLFTPPNSTIIKFPIILSKLNFHTLACISGCNLKLCPPKWRKSWVCTLRCYSSYGSQFCTHFSHCWSLFRVRMDARF